MGWQCSLQQLMLSDILSLFLWFIVPLNWASEALNPKTSMKAALKVEDVITAAGDTVWIMMADSYYTEAQAGCMLGQPIWCLAKFYIWPFYTWPSLFPPVYYLRKWTLWPGCGRAARRNESLLIGCFTLRTFITSSYFSLWFSQARCGQTFKIT